MSPALQALVAAACIAVLAVAGLWIYQQQQAYALENSPAAKQERALNELRESVDDFERYSNMLSR